MNAQAQTYRGFLGRGPLFWGSMAFVTTALIVALGLSDAIDNKGLLVILLVIPMAMVMALFRSVYLKSQRGDGTCVPKGAAQARYIKRVAVFTSLYLASFAALTFLDAEQAISGPLRFLVALLPGLAISGFFWAIGRLIVEEQDEFLRMLTVRQTLVASAIALSAASIWGFLESADLVPHMDVYWVAIVWFGGLFIGALINRIEHGTWGAA